MKRIILLSLLFLSQVLFAGQIPSVKEQLNDLNKYWFNKEYDFPILKERISLNEVSLIQMHLRLIEKILRQRSVGELSVDQKENRYKCLDILHDYCLSGVFPKNLYHKNRTPYFIDDYGTACAVGQLIISTGYESLAKEISVKNNYSYIKELNIKYPQIKMWADKYGFTIEELAWIQPGYCCTGTTCTGIKRNVSCYGGYDGCVGGLPTNITLPNPVTYELLYFDPVFSIWYNYGCPCDVVAGTIYKWRVTNFLGEFEDIIDTISQPDSISIVMSSSKDFGSCHGSATANVSGGTPPYSYFWSPGGRTIKTATGLCSGKYFVVITDANNCTKTDSVVVSLITGIKEKDSFSNHFYPNPLTSSSTLQLNTQVKNADVVIYDVVGKEMWRKKMSGDRMEIERGNLESGVYFVRVSEEEKQFVQKIVIQ